MKNLTIAICLAVSMVIQARADIKSENGNSYIAVKVNQNEKSFFLCKGGSECVLLGGRAFTDMELQNFVMGEKKRALKAKGIRIGVTIAGVVIGAVIDAAIVIASASTSGGALIYLPIIGSVAGGVLSWTYSPRIISLTDEKSHTDRVGAVQIVNENKHVKMSEDQIFETARVLRMALEKISKLDSNVQLIENNFKTTMP